jgi:hypothetical protein
VEETNFGAPTALATTAIMEVNLVRCKIFLCRAENSGFQRGSTNKYFTSTHYKIALEYSRRHHVFVSSSSAAGHNPSNGTEARSVNAADELEAKRWRGSYDASLW